MKGAHSNKMILQIMSEEKKANLGAKFEMDEKLLCKTGSFNQDLFISQKNWINLGPLLPCAKALTFRTIPVNKKGRQKNNITK